MCVGRVVGNGAVVRYRAQPQDRRPRRARGRGGGGARGACGCCPTTSSSRRCGCSPTAARNSPEPGSRRSTGCSDCSELIPEGEEAAAAPLVAAAGGDEHLARAVWAMAHGLADLELSGRFPSGAELDATWRTALSGSQRWRHAPRSRVWRKGRRPGSGGEARPVGVGPPSESARFMSTSGLRLLERSSVRQVARRC